MRTANSQTPTSAPAIADFRPADRHRDRRGEIHARASGASPAAAISSLTGIASLEAANGSILGVNLEEALRRSHRKPVDVERCALAAVRAFDNRDVPGDSTRGRAQVNAAS